MIFLPLLQSPTNHTYWCQVYVYLSLVLSNALAIRLLPDSAIRQFPNWSPILSAAWLDQYFRRHSIQFRQNHPRPISTKLWWSILLFQGTFQIKGQFWHCSSQIFSKKRDTSRKCVPRFETNKWIIGIVKIVLVFSYQFKTTIISDVWLEG